MMVFRRGLALVAILLIPVLLALGSQLLAARPGAPELPSQPPITLEKSPAPTAPPEVTRPDAPPVPAPAPGGGQSPQPVPPQPVPSATAPTVVPPAPRTPAPQPPASTGDDDFGDDDFGDDDGGDDDD